MPRSTLNSFSRNVLAALPWIVVIGCATPAVEEPEPAQDAPVIVEDITSRLEQFAPVELTADLEALSPSDREVLSILIEAGRLMDEIFLSQAWAGGPELRDEMASWQGPKAAPAAKFFDINFGPWDRLDERHPFIGEQEHPEGAGFYPEDATKEELEAWMEDHPEAAEGLRSLTTIVRREGDGFVAIPYSEAYKEFLEPAAALLRKAAEATDNESLRIFLSSRADAFASDDYYVSDLAWMDLDAPVEVTIGPYETYEDGLFGYKAAFEAFVTVALPEESRALDRYKSRLPWLERNLPIPDEDKNLDRGTESPMRVVDLVFAGGDTRAGVQTVAFNLPNDERVREAKGSKKVLLRNVMRAKYDRILLPIAERTLAEADISKLSFKAFFEEVLHHELSHGLGPGMIEVDGRSTEVRLELKELYSTIEEAKADVMGIHNILALIDQGEMPADLRSSLEPTYLAGLFRSARFGLDEAHGQGVVAQFNHLLEQGALVVDPDGRFSVVSERFARAIEKLLGELLTLQASGDYPGTAAFLERYGQATPDLRAAIDRLGEVPVDIHPQFVQAE